MERKKKRQRRIHVKVQFFFNKILVRRRGVKKKFPAKTLKFTSISTEKKKRKAKHNKGFRSKKFGKILLSYFKTLSKEFVLINSQWIGENLFSFFSTKKFSSSSPTQTFFFSPGRVRHNICCQKTSWWQASLGQKEGEKSLSLSLDAKQLVFIACEKKKK